MTQQHSESATVAMASAALLLGLGLSACLLAQNATGAELVSWSAPASVSVVEEEKIFESGSSKLSGTLYLARGRKPQSALVVTHAAAAPLRDLPLYRHLKEMLPALGIAVFIYDRRGSGKSGGDLQSSDYTLLADDAIAAVRMLKADTRIDPQRVGIWGLSQGGWLALLAASRSSEPSFIISASAPLVSPDVQMMFRSINSLRVHGYPNADIEQMMATRKAVDDYMRGTGDRATAQRLVDAAKTKPWFKLLYMSEKVGDRATSRWRKEIEFDPLRTLDKVKIPTLVIYGALDPVVPVAASVERLRVAHPKLDVVVIAGADHAMQVSVPAQVQMDPARTNEQAPEAVEYFAIMASWLTRQAIAAPMQSRLTSP
jgi:pimeloyl-ACP methyl ester carboxylesterase